MVYLAILLTLILPAAVWVYYAYRTEGGIWYIAYGIIAYFALQLVLRPTSYSLIGNIVHYDTNTAVLVNTLLSCIYFIGGLIFIFFVFYKQKMEPQKAFGVALGYACIGTMVLYGVNSFLSLTLNQPLQNSDYLGAIVESIYVDLTSIMMILFLALDIKENKWGEIIILTAFFFVMSLLNSRLFNSSLGQAQYEWIRYLILFAWTGFYLALGFIPRFKAFYGSYLRAFFHLDQKLE